MQYINTLFSKQRDFYKSHQTRNIKGRLILLKKLKAEVISNETAILEALKKDFKKSAFEGYLSEVGLVLSELDLTIKKLKSWAKKERVKSALLTFPSKDYIYKEPYGNVLVIAPWNYPFLLALEPVIMAIAAGNTVVLKPSELTTNTAAILTKIIKKVFPGEVATTVEGGVEVATALLEKPWDYIFFTGSTQVGKIVAEAAAKHLTPTTLELGGKSPCIVDETADLKLVARRLVWGKFFNGGQTCIAGDYVLVKAPRKEALIQALSKEIEKRYTKNPKSSEDFPRIVNNDHLNRLINLLENQTVVFGGDFDESDNYLAPTIVDEPDMNTPLMKEEIFGPILPILSYSTEEDIRKTIAESSRPLSFYIFSKNKTFVDNLLNTINFGGGVVNDLLVQFGNPRLPFGGIGTSGMGSYHGKFGFDTFSHHKAVMIRSTWFDPSFRYPPYKGKLKLLKKFLKYFS
ncbi:aldehyde dehydrogenase [Gaetbulibacter sp. M240]|uniref:aldehyde dehydrogenase n=1 Tax=Gaetbulibacter sp. M240 TaxID=3126511 RepID=UPI00374E6A1C